MSQYWSSCRIHLGRIRKNERGSKKDGRKEEIRKKGREGKKTFWTTVYELRSYIFPHLAS